MQIDDYVAYVEFQEDYGQNSPQLGAYHSLSTMWSLNHAVGDDVDSQVGVHENRHERRNWNL
jgi:hypothetical protein